MLVFGPLVQAGWPLQQVERHDDRGPSAGTVSSLLAEGPWAAPWQIEQWVLKEINYERLIRGLPVLQFDATLAQVAEQHSQDMVKRGFFAHTTPDGQTLEKRLKLQGVREWRLASENLAIHHDWLAPVSRAIDGWMMSPGHKQNILDGRFKYTGIGVAYGVNGSLYLTQIFLDR